MPLYIERETESKMVERARIQSQASEAQICVICQSTGCRLRLHFYDVPSFLQFLHEPTKFWETLPCSKGTSILKGYGFGGGGRECLDTHNHWNFSTMCSLIFRVWGQRSDPKKPINQHEAEDLSINHLYPSALRMRERLHFNTKQLLE